MVLARWQATIVDEAGNIQTDASIEVRREDLGNPLAVIYSDRAGATPIGNPFLSDMEGHAAFHVAGGAYRITATKGDFSRIWRYVAIGLAAESDAVTAGLPWRYSADTADSDPGSGYLKFNNAALASATALRINGINIQTADLSTWIESWDNGGNVLDRGTVVIQSQSGGALIVATITGTISDDGDYYDVAITPIDVIGSFVSDELLHVQFMGTGIGQGDVLGPDGGVLAGQIAMFSDTTGKLIGGLVTDDSPTTPLTKDNIGTGVQTIYIDGGGLKAQSGAGGATPVDFVSASNNNTMAGMSFADAGASRVAGFKVAMPKSWDLGAIEFEALWTAASGSGDVRWTFEVKMFSNDDTLSQSAGPNVQVVDTLTAVDDLCISPRSLPLFPNNPVQGDLLFVYIIRNSANADDTLNAAAVLLGVRMFYRTAANTDD